MLWSKDKQYYPEPFDTESEFETAIIEVSRELFGPERIYIDCKKRIGKKGKTANVPDAYLLDLSSPKEPKLFVIENELSKHEPLKHIAVQILEFSLSFETSQIQVKNILKENLANDTQSLEKCKKYININGFENLDVLLEKTIYGEDKFNALVIIDLLDDELEHALISRFQFPIETLTLQRFKSDSGERVYNFDPFLGDITTIPIEDVKFTNTTSFDPADIDTIVVPAREDGFQETFIGENCWYAIRIHASMLAKLKHIAAYRVAPESAITHIADIENIEKWKDTNKYIVHFKEPAREIGPIKLVPKSIVKAPQAPRYTKLDRLVKAKSLDEVF